MSLRTLSTFSVTLSCDADPAPGGYVVQERENITFTCNHSLSDSRDGVLWEVDLRVPGGKVTNIASQGVVAMLPQVTSPDTTQQASQSAKSHLFVFNMSYWTFWYPNSVYIEIIPSSALVHSNYYAATQCLLLTTPNVLLCHHDNPVHGDSSPQFIGQPKN